jgi:hypothetical protein
MLDFGVDTMREKNPRRVQVMEVKRIKEVREETPGVMSQLKGPGQFKKRKNRLNFLNNWSQVNFQGNSKKSSKIAEKAQPNLKEMKSHPLLPRFRNGKSNMKDSTLRTAWKFTRSWKNHRPKIQTKILAMLLSKRDQEGVQSQSLNKFRSSGLSKSPSLYRNFKEILILRRPKIHDKICPQFFLQTIILEKNQTKTTYGQEKGSKTNKEEEMTKAEIQGQNKLKVLW